MKQWGIYYADFGKTVGREQSGQRPVIVVKEFVELSLCIIVPLTSQPDAERFENTIKISKTSNTKLKMNSVALLYQMRSIGFERIISNETGTLADYQIEWMRAGLRGMLELQQSL